MANQIRAARTLSALTGAGAEIVDTARKLGESAVAAGTVIGHRVAMGAQALHDPASLDAEEMMRMGAEKLEAFGASSSAAFEDLQGIHRELASYATRQAVSSMRAVFDVVTARDPLSAFAAQHRWLVEGWARGTDHAARLTALSAGLSAAAVAPVHKTVTGNARRLSRGKK
ncbi:MAG TPA: phasin family protein [Aliidongia sp.]|nr:phasin family protein [Aliidongia sp.]